MMESFYQSWIPMDDAKALARKLAELKAEHRELDEQIAEATVVSHFDQLELQRMKKRKLALKDRITRLESGRLPDIIA